MASSRQTGTNENVQTYGNGTRDFTSLSTWEAEVDVDTTAAGTATTEILDCHADSSSYTDNIYFQGGTHDSTYPVVMRAASGDENKLTQASGFLLTRTDSTDAVRIWDDSVYVYDIGVDGSFTGDGGGATIEANSATDNVRLVGVYLYDLTSTGTGSPYGFDMISTTDAVLCNCAVSVAESAGVRCASTTSIYVYNCTVADVTGNGYQVNTSTTLKNCLADNSGGSDFTGGAHTDSDYNASSDTTAPGTNSQTSQTFTFVGASDYHLSGSDTGATDLGTDLDGDSNFSFDDDVDLETRSGTWDIGADEVVSAAASTAKRLKRMGIGK
jgi:hypothetical protein